MHTIYQRIGGASFYWTTCGWSDRVRNARRYKTAAEARLVATRMKIDGVPAAVARMNSFPVPHPSTRASRPRLGTLNAQGRDST